jgi:excinuclease UvrABC ATPase subunit
MASPDYGAIRIRGARENNLKNVSLDIPKRRLTVFTGVSGSGKSSLVFDTLAAESRRLINETYAAFIQGFMDTPPRPDVDVLEGLTAAIIVDQEPMGANPRSTVGTATDAHAMLRIIFSRLGVPHVGPASAFSFNVPAGIAQGEVTLERGGGETESRNITIAGGMCPECEGIGKVAAMDMTAVVDESKSLNAGALLPKDFAVDSWWWEIYRSSGFFDMDKPIKKYTKEEREKLLNLDDGLKVKVGKINLTYQGVVPKLKRSLGGKDPEAMQPHVRAEYERIFTRQTCPACGGSRLNAAARSSRVGGKNIAECAAMQITDLAAWLDAIEAVGAKPIIDNLSAVLAHFIDIGLAYLSLDRATSTLSGGESQRVRMVRHLGSALTDITYVFDEPTIGLHAHDVERMNTLLRQLRDKGNTVLVVEHDPDVMHIADHLIDIGPGAGSHGGEIVYQGDYDGLLKSGTATGRYLERRSRLKDAVRQPTGSIPIRNARLHNLQDVSVDIPLGVLVAVTGVAGSGKSSLIHGCMPRSDKSVAFIDQSAIRGSRRSNPATYAGVADPMRRAFAKANNVKPGLFSPNSEGACPKCKGLGVLYTDLAFVAGVVSTCDLCEGRRFTDAVLDYRLRGKNIADVLDMTVEEAADFFKPERAVRDVLQRLVDVGLGYVVLGQTLNTLSGGERQRLRLASEMSTDTELYVLDEPTTGLHLQDIEHLASLLDRLVDGGRSVVVIEHNLDVIARADWVIDIGPGAGHDGGRVIFSGRPADLATKGDTLTGRYLSRLQDGARDEAE